MGEVTIREAEANWCPYRRLSVHDTKTCIANKCMMWRYWRADNERHDNPRGYCGLAGEIK